MGFIYTPIYVLLTDTTLVCLELNIFQNPETYFLYKLFF